MNERCLLCGEATLEPVAGYTTLPRVTSDCKPWAKGGELAVCAACGMIQKPPSDEWLAEIHEIYESYSLYHQADGAEQPIFSADGSSVPRSRLLVDYVAQRFIRAGENGRLIDIGCGNGAALRNFSLALPGWSFDANELTDKALPILREMRGFRMLYTGALGDIPARYDVVTMIHALEHIVDPAAALAGGRRLLKPDGILFIQVPDIETSPFDLLVADHRSHFTRNTLGALAARQGFEIDLLENTVLRKENTLLGHPNGSAHVHNVDPSHGIRIVQETVRWLHAVLEKASDASRASDFGLFGSSISAMWLYGALRERVRFFVDEDSARVGRQIDGKPILAPDDAPANSTVFVPLVASVAAPLVRRLSQIGAAFVPPPA